MTQSRLSSLQSSIHGKPYQAFFISHPASIYYFFGLVSFHHDYYALVTPKSVDLFVAPLSPKPNFEVRLGSSDTLELTGRSSKSKSNSFPTSLTTHPTHTLSDLISKITATTKPYRSFGIEQDLTYQEATKFFPHKPKIIPASDLALQPRQIKSPEEILLISHACALTAKAMRYARKKLSPGITERELARLIVNFFYHHGADDLAFPPIVSFDAHTALPHHTPDDTPYTNQSIVLIDIGCQISHYCSDMTRTFLPLLKGEGQAQPSSTGGEVSPNKENGSRKNENGNGKLKTENSEPGSGPISNLHFLLPISNFHEQISKNQKMLMVQEIVLNAYTNALNLLQPPTSNVATAYPTAAAVDQAVRDVLNKYDLEKYFIHSTGHGLGLDIHEPPSISAGNPKPLLENQVITIEPGVYFDGAFGYRHEDTVLLSKTGPIILTK
jgi:Xaa-Pro aminopeptidase